MPFGTEITLNRTPYSVLLHPVNEGALLTNHASTALFIYALQIIRVFRSCPMAEDFPFTKVSFLP